MKNLIRNVWVCLGLMVLPFTASGQQKDNITYVPAQELLLVGKATTEGEYFHRVDTAKYRTMPPTVKKLFTNSAGLAISFTTNSPVIKAKWMVPDNYQLPNLTRVAQKGLDLYIKRDGKWQFAGVGIPGGVTTEKVLVDNMGTEEKECLLYLPLYDELKSLEIGVSSDAHIHKGENPFKEKIVVYGSSILQGASASRPGMAYPAQLERATGFEFVNLGASGQCKMEQFFAHVAAACEADAFLFDSFSNPSAQQIEERTLRSDDPRRTSHDAADLPANRGARKPQFQRQDPQVRGRQTRCVRSGDATPAQTGQEHLFPQSGDAAGRRPRCDRRRRTSLRSGSRPYSGSDPAADRQDPQKTRHPLIPPKYGKKLQRILLQLFYSPVETV